MCVDCVEFVEFKGSKSEMAQPVSSPGKRSNNGGTTHCFADSSSASRRWINSGSGSALAAKKLRALTQIHSEDEPHSVAPNLPPKPSKLGRRMSFSNNPGTKLTAMSKGADKVPEKCRRHSDASGKPGPRGKLFGHFDNNSNCVGNPRFCSPSLCFAGSKPQSEDGQGEVSNVGTKGKHGNVSDELPVSGEHSERIMVYVRVRPLSKKEEEAGARNCVCVSNNRDLYLNDSVNENDYLRSKRDCGRHYRFDAVFPESVGQQEVYNTSVAELVDGVLQGRNASVLCYGATGAGKTYTMLGTVGSPGVMVIAIKDLFAKLEQLSFNSEHVVCISYLEVYNEAVKDLLSPGKALVLREDKQGNVSAGLTQHNTYSAEEVMTLLHRGNQNRATEATRMNETSSRSHAILQVVLEYKLKEASTTVIRTGKLSLVDLAGSERATATDQLTVRSVEGASINKSLLALSSCIRALVDQKKHVPYRLSKLTQLLKDSLGGACQTAMIANISPSSTSYSETQNTLHWANQAKEIRTKSSTANEELEIPDSQIEMTKQLLESQKQNEELRMQVAQLEQRLLAVESQKLTSSPSFPCSSPNLPSPFTPPATVHLRRGIQDLKEESDHMKTEYSFQLKHKDDVIRKLYKMGSGVEQMIQNNVSVPTSADVSVIQPSETLTPKKPTRTTISAPQNDYDSPYYRRSRFSDVGLKSPSPSPSPYRKLSLSGTEKKRPFGDITNDTTGTESRGKMDTSDPPSMLLKPGFYGEPPNC